MRVVPIILAGVALLLAVPATGADVPKREPKPRAKGVEAYSWKDDQGVRYFTLLNGTNRIKTEQEVKASKTVYAGADRFVAALELLAEGEMVLWTHNIKGFEYPPKADLEKIDTAAKAAKLELYRIEE